MQCYTRQLRTLLVCVCVGIFQRGRHHRRLHERRASGLGGRDGRLRTRNRPVSPPRVHIILLHRRTSGVVSLRAQCTTRCVHTPMLDTGGSRLFRPLCMHEIVRACVQFCSCMAGRPQCLIVLQQPCWVVSICSSGAAYAGGTARSELPQIDFAMTHT